MCILVVVFSMIISVTYFWLMHHWIIQYQGALWQTWHNFTVSIPVVFFFFSTKINFCFVYNRAVYTFSDYILCRLSMPVFDRRKSTGFMANLFNNACGTLLKQGLYLKLFFEIICIPTVCFCLLKGPIKLFIKLYTYIIINHSILKLFSSQNDWNLVHKSKYTPNPPISLYSRHHCGENRLTWPIISCFLGIICTIMCD